MPALVYSVGEGGRNLPQQKIREGMLAAAAIGYLCKHNATLSGAEGGCQAEIGVASGDGCGVPLASARLPEPGRRRTRPRARSSTTWAMTCDPVAGFVQIPCIERCAFGAVKAWTGFLIASNEIRPTARRLRHDGDRDGADREGDETRSTRRLRKAAWPCR
jgi:L-serine dehydratase